MASAHRILIIGKIWPEPSSSAAGTRTLDLIRSFQNRSWEIHFACAASTSEHSADLSKTAPVSTHSIQLNDSSFDTWIATLAPDIVVFDRYMTEEQFGWRVEKAVPQAFRILDTSDLHLLRDARHTALKQQTPLSLYSPIAHREIASILRSDLTLVISEFERDLLLKEFSIPEFLIAYWPFALSEPLASPPSFEERQHFAMIGSFLHEPNWDAVLWTHREIWPLIRKELPQAELHIYGSYPPPKALQLNNPANGFLVRGRAENAIETLSRYRINLAPLRFGAGLKGKLADAFIAGTPSVTTPIGAEGMHGSLPWPSRVSECPARLAASAIELHQSKPDWLAAQSAGYEIARNRFADSDWLPALPALIEKSLASLERNRERNFYGSLLKHHQYRSSEFMSRWIEAKNKLPHPPGS